jgi:glycosyltransferase involved in cell wall biosynthesis
MSESSKRLDSSKVMVIEACDFDGFPVGGQLTSIKQLMMVYGNRLALVGISTENGPVGQWTKKRFGGVEYDFFSVGRVDPTIRKPWIPRRFDAYLRLKRYKKGILSLGLDAAFVIAPEVMLAIKGWGLRIAYTFAGVENPLTMPRYVMGKWLAGPFERGLFSALAKHSEVIMAAADQKAIQAMKVRSKGVLADKPVFSSPTVVDTRIFNLNRPKEPIAGPVLVSCGRLNIVKGWDLVFDAYLKVKNEIPSARLYFVGDGEDRGKLEARIAEAGADNSVFITGFLEPRRVAEMLNTAHLFLLGSHKEGWPTALVEAQACGLPAVVTDVSGASSIVEQGRNGFIAQDRDAAEFAKKIVAALQLECPNPTSLKIGGRHSLESWKATLSELWEPLR